MKKLKILFVFLIISATLCVGLALAANDKDAIAVRVVSNPNHYSALRWYTVKNFKGAPQSLLVDGYEAIRDGRTVYVNAANIVGGALYTNVYLLSFNQQASNATNQIFGSLLENWKFNPGVIGAGKCNQSGKGCLLDSDCGIGEVCDSRKAKIVRDTRRLADLNEIKIALKRYRDEKGFYPRLTSGTYLNGRTTSAWPSWKENLELELSANLPVDPVNKFGDCPGYSADTCWNENTKKFAGDVPSGLPSGSFVYAYKVLSNGAGFIICANTESGYFSNSFQCLQN